MEKYICPVCDQEIPFKHYCKACKIWVKEPLVKKSTYYLNENHPDDENDCTYHVQAALNRVMDATDKAMKQVMTSDNQRDTINSMPKKQEPEKEVKRHPFNGIAIVVCFFLFINVILPALSRIISQFFSLFK